MSLLKIFLATRYSLNNIKKVYLIPSKEISNEKIKYINSLLKYDEKDTVIIRFNRCDMSNSKLFNNKTHIRFLRGHGLGQNLRIDYTLYGETDQDAVYLANNENFKEINFIKNKNSLKYIFSFEQMGVVWKYPLILSKLGVKTVFRGKGPSIGFIALFNLMDVFPNAIFYLLDFTFEGTCFHDMKLEKRICAEVLKNRVVIV